MADMVSIIIPHLNQPTFLERCLASLAPQIAAQKNVEVIVVDNGSKQLPVEVLNRYAWARLEQEKEAGPGPARNTGIAVSHGQLLAFIDADCVAHADWLRCLSEIFSANPTFEVLGGDVRIGLVDASRPTMLEAYESVFAYRQAEYISKYRFSGTGNLAMRRPSYFKVGPFAGIGVAEDREWGRRATKAGVVIHYVPEMIVYHPARQTFGELRKKWDRHISHDFNEKAAGIGGRLKWVALIFAVAVSGVADVQKILVSDRISTARERVLASIMLFRVRLYRSWRMLGLVFQRGTSGPKWNT
jgi:GT2 family glycosyltransferase